MATISFKSVGKTREQTLAEAVNSTVVPIGIKTPLRSGDDSVFAMHTSLIDQIHDNLRNLLLTNHGERLGLYDYGANLRPLATEFVNQDDFDAAAVERISTAVSRWMPFVSLDNFLSQVDDSDGIKGTTSVKFKITYTVPSLQTSQRALEVTIYAI